jgi:hypothetical protein
MDSGHRIGGDHSASQQRRALPQVGAKEGDGSIPCNRGLLRVVGSEEVLLVQEGVAGGIVDDLGPCAGVR